jgi:hypothetical protein
LICHGDGQTRSFDVGYELHRAPIIAVNGYYQQVGQKGTTDDATWFWQAGSTMVTQRRECPVLMREDRLDIIFIGKYKVETVRD